MSTPVSTNAFSADASPLTAKADLMKSSSTAVNAAKQKKAKSKGKKKSLPASANPFANALSKASK